MKKLRVDVERFRAICGRSGPVSTGGFFVACVNPRMAPVTLLRLAEYFNEHRLGVLAKLCSMLNVLVFGIEVSPKVQIGGGLFLPHTVGTVIGAARIGTNCTIQQGVTLGSAEPDIGFTASMRPIVGDDVYIGAGAKIIGGVTVGDRAKVGANAVVLSDVPPGALAVGVPARLVEQAATDVK